MKNNLPLIYFALFLLFFQVSTVVNAQFGGIQLNTAEAQHGYVLFQSANTGTYLINNCGEVINQWPSISNTDLHPKLLPNGNVIYIKNSTVFERDWDNNIVNSINIPFGSLELKYEVIKLPNGNYLSAGRRAYSFADFTALGFNYGFQTPVQVDVVVELDASTGDIVWEWNIADHVIQERDASKNNYGVIADHPELLNMDALSTYDWYYIESFMINGIGYNPELDQIALSIRKMSEVAIIDHSTTTEEAAGHSGGNSGKGGDILYRWGNPQNYGQGTAADRFLFLQHNPKWIMDGSNAGKMTCYNNGLDRPQGFYSQVPILTTPVDANGNYSLAPDTAYEPAEPDFTYGATTTNTAFYSEYTSGAELLPNGNIFITEGVIGRLLEVNPDGEIVWNYNVPDVSYIFRTEKYPTNYPAFVGRDMSPSGELVSGADSNYNCEFFISSTEDIKPEENTFSIQYLNNRIINVHNKTGNGFSYVLYDAQGGLKLSGESLRNSFQLSGTDLSAGFYVLTTSDAKSGQWHSNKILLR